MKLLDLTPMIWTEQIDETLKFYTEILGFTLHEYNKEWEWAALGKDDVGMMVAKPGSHTPFVKPTYTGTFYFSTDNVDELWNKLKDKVKVAYEIENFEYGMRDFAIYDNNGYMLQFGQEIKV
jgi:predicted enzyme related to lactoylglutathione lyase